MVTFDTVEIAEVAACDGSDVDGPAWQMYWQVWEADEESSEHQIRRATVLLFWGTWDYFQTLPVQVEYEAACDRMQVTRLFQSHLASASESGPSA